MEARIFDVDETNFEEAVLQASSERIIVVDFWAPWCQPCRTLGPILEEVVTELGDGVALARVNVDENQQLAMAFRVQGIPAVKIIKDGRPVEEFTGALPKAQIEALLRPLVPTQEDDLLEQARALADAGSYEEAARLYDRVLQEQPDAAEALVGLAQIHLQQGDVAAVEEVAGKVEQGAPEHARAQALLQQIEFGRLCAAAGGRAECARKMLADPGDLEARFDFACCAAAAQDYATALKEWLAVVQKEKDFRDGAAREAMVSIFHLLGREDELVADYQRRLYRALY